MTVDVRSGRDTQGAAVAVISAGTNGRTRQSGAANRKYRLIILGIELGAVARYLRSRRLRENVILGVIALAALARASRENQARALARLAAWDKQRNLRQQRTAKARST
jgi:hypothetical protein